MADDDNTTDAARADTSRREKVPGVAALGAELERLTRTVAALEKTLQAEKRRIGAGVQAAKELLDQRDQLRVVVTERLPELEDGLKQLAQTVERLAGNDEDEAPGVGSWMDIDAEAEQTVAMLRDVADWVATVLLHYPEAASKLPSCWWQHPDLVEHLLVLRASWGVAFAGSGTALARADWLERHLPAAVTRIAETGRDCLREHRVHRPRSGYAAPTEAQLGEEAHAWAVREREVRPVPVAGPSGAGPYATPNPYPPQP